MAPSYVSHDTGVRYLKKKNVALSRFVIIEANAVLLVLYFNYIIKFRSVCKSSVTGTSLVGHAKRLIKCYLAYSLSNVTPTNNIVGCPDHSVTESHSAI